MPVEAPSSLRSLLRINVPRESDVNAPYIRPAGRDIRRGKGPKFLGTSGPPRSEHIFEPAIDQLAGGSITGHAIALIAQKISYFGKVDPNQPASTRKTEADVERTSEEDVAGNVQYCLTRLVPRQRHQQFRIEGFLYLALVHAPARAFPTQRRLSQRPALLRSRHRRRERTRTV